MVDHHLLVLGELDIQFHAIAGLRSPGESRQGVFRNSLGFVVQPAMGVIISTEGNDVGSVGALWPDQPEPQQEEQQENNEHDCDDHDNAPVS